MYVLWARIYCRSILSMFKNLKVGMYVGIISMEHHLNCTYICAFKVG